MFLDLDMYFLSDSLLKAALSYQTTYDVTGSFGVSLNTSSYAHTITNTYQCMHLCSSSLICVGIAFDMLQRRCTVYNGCLRPTDLRGSSESYFWTSTLSSRSDLAVGRSYEYIYFIKYCLKGKPLIQF